MLTFLLWCILLIFCWPLALIVLVLYPICVAGAAAVPHPGNCGGRSASNC